MRKDSLPVLRLKLAGGTVDTVARLSVPEFGEATFGPQRQTVAQIFGPTDIFGVLPDGTIWVARARTMSVDWRTPDGTWTTRTGAQLCEGGGDGGGQEAGDGPPARARPAEQRGGGVPVREDEAVVRGGASDGRAAKCGCSTAAPMRPIR